MTTNDDIMQSVDVNIFNCGAVTTHSFMLVCVSVLYISIILSSFPWLSQTTNNSYLPWIAHHNYVAKAPERAASTTLTLASLLSP